MHLLHRTQVFCLMLCQIGVLFWVTWWTNFTDDISAKNRIDKMADFGTLILSISPIQVKRVLIFART